MVHTHGCSSEKSKEKVAGEIKMAESRRMLSSPHPRNTSKIQLHIEQFSLKTNWRLVERLFYNEASKERFTQSQVGREEKLSDQGLRPEQGTQRGGGYITSSGILPWSEGLETHIGHP